MVTNYPHRIASTDRLAQVDADRADDGFGMVMVAKVRQAFCGMHGHDSLLQFEQDRMFLRCVSCGHESPGWELTETPPTVREQGDARRHVLVPPQLIAARRIA